MRVRFVTEDDASAIAAIYRPIVEATTISFEEIAPDEHEMRARIRKTLATHPWLVAEDDGVRDAPDGGGVLGDPHAGGVLGYAYAGRWRERPAYRWSVETTAYVHERARGRGVGRALYLALFRLLSAQGFHRAYAGITLPNDASVALHTSVGFTPVGVYHDAGCKLGRWCDVAWFERPLSDAAAPPAEPIAPAALSDAAVARALTG